MNRLVNGFLAVSSIAGIAAAALAPAAADDSTGAESGGWVPAISAFSGLVSAGRAVSAAPSSWAVEEKPLEVGDTVEIIQVLMLPESVAVAAGASEQAPRYVIEKSPTVGADGSDHWVLTQVAPPAEGSQGAGPPDGGELRPADSIDGEEILVPPPEPAAQAAPAEAIVRDEAERWVPSVAIFSGVVAADVEAEVHSSTMGRRFQYQPRLPPPWPQFSIFDATVLPAEPVRPAAFGDDLNIEPFIGGQVELMTPGLTKLPGKPRLYVAGDVAWSFGFNRDVAKEGDPGEMITSPDPMGTLAASIEGQGSRATTEPRNLVIGANAGMAFSIDIGDRRLRIKPNAGYLRQEIEYTGSVNRTLLINTGRNNPDPIPPTPTVWETIEMKGSAEETYHAVGPGLELELDTARAGPFVLSLFATGNAYRVISGDRRIEFEATDTWENYLPTELGGGTVTEHESASWKFEKDPWSYRGAVGIRFRWVPE